MSEPSMSQPSKSEPVGDEHGKADPSTAGVIPELPPAALDVSQYRHVVEDLARPAPSVKLGLIAFLIAVVLLLAVLVVTGQSTGPDVLGELIASGVVGIGVLLALLVVLPAQLTARRKRRLNHHAASLREAAAAGIRQRLAAIGYTVPRQTALDWLSPTDLDATVPLVHDSVIAARLWRPTLDDDRVFLEPYLRQGSTSSSLPVLPAV